MEEKVGIGKRKELVTHICYSRRERRKEGRKEEKLRKFKFHWERDTHDKDSRGVLDEIENVSGEIGRGTEGRYIPFEVGKGKWGW